MNRRFSGACAVALASLLPSLSGQSVQLQEEVEFVRGLVTDLRFVGLAQFEVAYLKQAYKNSDDFKIVAQLDIEVSLQGAKRHPDRATRRTLYKNALLQSEDFIERYSEESVANDARVTLSEACIEFGVFLNNEIELAKAEDPDRVLALEKEAAEVFRKGITAAEETQATFFEQDPDSIEGYVAWMRKAILMREQARAIREEREYLASEAEDNLIDLILDIGEETVLGQRALFELAKVEEVRGDLDAAITSYSDAINAIWEALHDSTVALPEAAERLMFSMMQEVYDRLVEVSYEQGMTDDVITHVAEFNARIAEFQTEPDPMFGDSLYLTEARVHADSGDRDTVSKAMETAKTINTRHPNDLVGLKAKALIREILDSSADLVTGALLLEVAIGDFQAQEYDAAIVGLQRALTGMNATDRVELGFSAWKMIGQANAQMSRHMEAAKAYAQALEDHGEDLQNKGDKDSLSELRDVSQRAFSALNRVPAETKQEAEFATLRQAIDTLQRNFNPDFAIATLYNDGNAAAAKPDHELAIALWSQVEITFDRYELAVGKRVMSLFQLARYKEARDLAAEYRVMVRNNPIPADERLRLGYRPQAQAWIHYTEGRMLYEEAKGTVDAPPDLTKFAVVEKHLLEWEAVHLANSPVQHPKVHEMLGNTYLELGDEAKASERYNKLKALSQSTPGRHKNLGLLMFRNFSAQVQALETELAGLFSSGEDTAQTETQLQEAQQKTLDLGLDYGRSIDEPSYAILYSTMRLAQRLEDWTSCEKIAETILENYGDSSEYSSLRQVKPLLGFALLHQTGRTREALNVLEEAEQALASRQNEAYFEVLRYKALALGGWPEYEGINYVPNLGMGEPEKAYEIYYQGDYRKRYGLHSQRAPEYSLEWFRYHLEVLFFCKEAARKGVNSQFATRANTFQNKAAREDALAVLEALGPEGRQLASLIREVARR